MSCNNPNECEGLHWPQHETGWGEAGAPSKAPMKCDRAQERGFKQTLRDNMQASLIRSINTGWAFAGPGASPLEEPPPAWPSRWLLCVCVCVCECRPAGRGVCGFYGRINQVVVYWLRPCRLGRERASREFWSDTALLQCTLYVSPGLYGVFICMLICWLILQPFLMGLVCALLWLLPLVSCVDGRDNNALRTDLHCITTPPQRKCHPAYCWNEGIISHTVMI